MRKLLGVLVCLLLVSGCGEFSSHIRNGYTYLEKKDYKQADAAFSAALQIKPDSEKALRGRTLTRLILQEQERAKKAELKASAVETELKLVKQTSTEEITRLKKDINRMKDQFKGKEEDFSREKARLSSQISERSRELAELKTQLSEFKEETIESKKKLADAKTNLSSLQEKLASASSTEEQYRKRLEEEKQEYIANLQKIRSENQRLKNEMLVIEKRILALKQAPVMEYKTALVEREPYAEIDQMFSDALERLNEIETEALSIEIDAKETP